MMTFDALGELVTDTTDGVAVTLTEAFTTVLADLAEGTPPQDVTTEVIERLARVTAYRAFEAGAEAQAQVLRVRTLADAVRDFGVALAERRAAKVAERALAVLEHTSERAVSSYARLAASILVHDSVRAGTLGVATYEGASRKQFIRLRPVDEPRAHSALEGKVLPLDEPYNIDGYLVDGPGDERLPWSSRANCGHVLKYLP